MAQNLLLTSHLYQSLADKYHIRNYTWNPYYIPSNIQTGYEKCIQLNNYTIIFYECILKNDIINIIKIHIYILYGNEFDNLQNNITHTTFKEVFLNNTSRHKNIIYYTFRITELSKVIRVFDQHNNIIEIEFDKKKWKYNIESLKPFHIGKTHCEFFLKLFLNYH